MSFRLVATLKLPIGTPIFCSIQPARTFPKFPVGTTNSTAGRAPAGSRSQAWR